MTRSLITSGADALDVSLGEGAVDGLLTLLAELQRWNKRVNLIGRCDVRQAVDRHIHDGLALLRLLDREAVSARASRWLDVGSGAGLPGLVLALARPELEIIMVEPIGKKVAFIRHAIAALGLEARASVRQQRVKALPEGLATAAMSRATFAPGRWAEVGRQLVGPDGLVLVTMGAGAPPALVEAAWQVDEVQLPLSGATRVNVVLG